MTEVVNGSDDHCRAKIGDKIALSGFPRTKMFALIRFGRITLPVSPFTERSPETEVTPLSALKLAINLNFSLQKKTLPVSPFTETVTAMKHRYQKLLEIEKEIVREDDGC